MEMEDSKRESRYKNLIELTGDGVMIISSDFTVTEVNERWCDLTGIERANSIGSRVESIPFIAESLKKQPLRFRQIETGEIDSCIHAIRHSNGSVVTVEMRSAKMPDGTYQSVFHDITELTKAEESLKLKSMFLEAVANSSADGILVVDLTGKKILQNQRTLELWKIGPEVAADPDGSRQVSHVMSMTKNPGQFFAEIEHQKKFPLDITVDQLELTDGTVLHRHSAPVLGPEGKNYGRIYHFHDVTSFRNAEEKIRGLLKEKEIILREVHHRIKNYMTMLSGLLTLQSSSLTDPLAIHALEDAQERIRGMQMMYDKLYVSAGFEAISAAEYLPNLIDEIIANFPRYAAITVEKQIADHILEPGILQVLSIITNELLSNIMKYAFIDRAEGTITVLFTISGNDAKFIIQDDGVGFPEPLAVDISDPSRISGGFGLLLVNMLVKQLHGNITFARQNGTRIEILFKI